MRVLKKNLQDLMKPFIKRVDNQLHIKRGKVEAVIDAVTNNFENTFTKLYINDFGKVFLDVYAADVNKSRKVASYFVGDKKDKAVIRLMENNKIADVEKEEVASLKQDGSKLLKGENYVIKEHIGVISKIGKKWQTELTLVEWFGKEAKYDIRDWSPDYMKRSKGVTLTKDELKQLYELLKGLFEAEDTHQVSEKCPIEQLYKKWDALVEHAPKKIAKLIACSGVDISPDKKVVVSIKKSNFDELAQEANRQLLTDFVSEIVGERVKVEIVGSSWL